MARVSARGVEEYMRLPYRMEIYDDGGYWAVEFPELPGLVAGHETWEGLENAVQDAKRAYFSAAIESGGPIPEPAARQEEFSGRFVVRVPRSIHRQAAGTAERDGMSLNTWVVAAIAKELGRGEPTCVTLPAGKPAVGKKRGLAGSTTR